jgi:hypothetical protein
MGLRAIWTPSRGEPSQQWVAFDSAQLGLVPFRDRQDGAALGM